MKKAKQIAFCSIFTALSVVLLFVGGAAFVLAYAMPIAVGMLMIIVDGLYGKRSALLIYIATSLLSVMIVPDRECALTYISFFGYYPILKIYIDKISSVLLRVITKLVIFNLTLATAQLVLVYIFGIPFLEMGESKYFILVFAVLMNILFIVYDKLIIKIRLLYIYKLEKPLKRLIK